MKYENDEFDYLGIVGREDSYTNLIKVFSDEGDKQTSRYYNMFSKSDAEIYYAKGNIYFVFML